MDLHGKALVWQTEWIMTLSIMRLWYFYNQFRNVILLESIINQCSIWNKVFQSNTCYVLIHVIRDPSSGVQDSSCVHMAFMEMIAQRDLLLQFYSWALQMDHFTKKKIISSQARALLTLQDKTCGRVETSEIFNEK